MGMESLVYSSGLDYAKKEAINVAMAAADEKRGTMNRANDDFTKAREEAATLEKEAFALKEKIQLRISSLQADLALAQDMKQRMGSGYWHMVGAPNDPTSRKLKAAWNAGKMNELHYYKSGSFKCQYLATLADCQRCAPQREKELEDIISTEKRKYTDLARK